MTLLRTPSAALRLAAALSFSCAALFGGATWAQSKPTPVPVDAQFDAARSADSLLKTSGAPAFKGVKKVVITQFTAEFLTYDAIAARASFGLGSGFSGGSATQVTRIHLAGLRAPEMQSLVDRLHGELQKRLADAGLEVLNTEQLKASSVYGRLAKAGGSLPLTEDTRSVVSAAGLGFFGMNRNQLSTQKVETSGPAGMLGNFARIGAGLSAATVIPDSMELQKDLGGDIGLIEVHLKINFAELSGSSSTWGTSNVASTQARATPEIRSANFQLFTGTTLGGLALEKPLALNPEAFAELKERPKSNAEVTGSVVGGLLAFAAGSNASTKSTTYDVVADPVKYPDVMSDGFGRLATMWTLRLQALR